MRRRLPPLSPEELLADTIERSVRLTVGDGFRFGCGLFCFSAFIFLVSTFAIALIVGNAAEWAARAEAAATRALPSAGR